VHAWKLYTRPNGGWATVFDWHNWMGRNSGQVSFVYYLPMILFAAVLAGVFGYLLWEQRKYKLQREKEKLEETEWYQRLKPLVDLWDYPDHEELYIYLDDADRPRLLAALQRQPKGSRSHRAAVQAVDPELIEDAGSI
jgi:hypothetical protein